MTKHTSRIWSTVTFAVVMMLFASVGFAHPSTVAPNTGGGTGRAAPSAKARGRTEISPAVSAAKRDRLVSYAEPSDAAVYLAARYRAGANATPAQIATAGQEYQKAWRQSTYHGPDLKAYQRLLNNEQRALAADSSPAALGLAVTGTLRLLTIAVEFGGPDPAVDFVHPASVFGSRECITETLTFDGPLHNEIPAPGPADNQTLWRPQFEKHHFEQIVLSTQGITERLRMDLTDPEDGQLGINLAGSSMRHYYTEVSGNRVQFDAGPRGIIAWVTVPHSEGYYAANACIDGDPGREQSMHGLPSNPSFPNGVDQLLKDIVDKINTDDPSFPWPSYDTDGNRVIDHVVIFHAGEDRSGGGGLQGYQAIWAHRGNVGTGGYVADDRGTANTADDIKLDGYTMQYENVGTGVLAHEFGHDLGLPDLYDISGVGESSVVWWDLMSTGSHPGKLFDTLPTHMSAWSKFALGWANIQSVTPRLAKQNVILGQTSGPPAGSRQAVRINLPPTTKINTELLPGSTQAWWSNNDQNWADVRLTRDVNLVGRTAPISISFDLDGAAELDWDYMFLEVSVDGGATYTQTKGFEIGSNNELTTPDDYGDPNGRLHDYGGLIRGYTGDISELADNPVPVGTHGNWVHAYHNLSAYANQNIKLRIRYATDAGFLERGYYVDNIKIRAAGATVLNDPVEGSNLNGWTRTITRFSLDEPLSAGWLFSNGIQVLPLYYLLEWRNLHGFDRGLKYTYNTIFATEPTTTTLGEWRVDKVPSNVPGMLVWLRDTRYGVEPFGAFNTVLDAPFFDPASEGPKGGLLVIDAHPNPLRGPLGGAITTGQGTYPFPPLNNWSGRVQTTNSAFGLQNTPALTLTATNEATTVFTPTVYVPLPAVSLFNDALGYYPGVEQLAVPVFSLPNRARIYAYSDGDASAVVPAKGYYPPRTPPGFTGQTQGSDVSLFETILYPLGNTSVGEAGGVEVVGQHSGNPGDSGVQYGYHFQVISKAANGSTGTIQIWVSLPLYLPVVRK